MRLVVNGCSYMQSYTDGRGHLDLAAQLEIDSVHTLAKSGSCNNRIIRTTLKDSYQATTSTLYVIGITFLTRHELPILLGSDEVEGKWQSMNSNSPKRNLVDLDEHITRKNIEDFCLLWDKFTVLGIEDLAVNLQYQLLSICDSLQHRGHRCIIFNTAESMLDFVLDNKPLELLKSKKQIIDGLKWKSIPWQFAQGVKCMGNEEHLPLEYRHAEYGHHQQLNNFLVDYINQHNILQ